jgi:plasmid stability protein
MRPLRHRGGSNMVPEVPTLTLKGIPAYLHRRLKARAVQNGRSLNGEVLACLQAAVGAERIDSEALLARARALRREVAGRLTDAELVRMKRAGRP